MRPGYRAPVVILAAAMVAVSVVTLLYRAGSPSDGARSGYVTSSLDAEGLEVATLSKADSPLLPGDRIVAIEGVRLEEWLLGQARVELQAGIGDSVAYTVRRGTTELEMPVPLHRYPVAQILLEYWGTVLFGVVMLLVGAYIYLRRPLVAAAAPLLLVGASAIGSTIPWLLGFEALDMALGTGFWLWLAGAFVCYSILWSAGLHFALVFPRRLSPLTRVRGAVALLYVAPLALIASWIGVAFVAQGSMLAALGSATTVQLATVLVMIVALVSLMVVQYRGAADTRTREQLAWIAWGGGISATMAFALWFGPELIWGGPLLPWSAIGLSALFFPTAVAVAVLRHRLFDIETVINRTLVYAGLTVGVLLVYVSTAALMGTLLRGPGTFAASLLGTGAAALAALPIRDRLQLVVNRMMYGDRDEPYRAIMRLGERLSVSLSTEEVLPTVVETVAHAMRLPYAAIELRADGITTLAAATGRTPQGELTRIELIDQGEAIGDLVVAPRAQGEQFSAADRQLLSGLAREAGKAARSVRLLAEIDRSNRELIAAREEERRRLRRDLHDGLGPTLAGARLKLQAARDLAAEGRSDAAGVLDSLDTDLEGLLDEVRRISRGLRPPALDELGFMPALRAQAERLAVDGRLQLRLHGPDVLPPLPAAVEAAAYWITLEALANVRRHSSATHCAVTVRCDEELEVEIEDDGRGIPAGTPAGVGLVAMRERAREVGGEFRVEPAGAGGGTRIWARLPLGAGPA